METYKTNKHSQTKMTQLMLPSHSNFSGKIHGGYILSLMDQIAFACASKYSGHYCVTASVNTVDFLHPVEVGQLLHLRASVNYTGTSSMVIGIYVESEDIKTGKINHCNSSYFTMVAKDENGNNAKVPGLIVDDEDGIRRFVRSISRYDEAKKRRARFSEEEFKAHNYIDLLKTQNVKINI
jgi:acyl-CoA hydrolase